MDNELMQQIEDNANELLKRCNLIVERVRDQWVLAADDGMVLLTKGGVGAFPKDFGRAVQMTAHRPRIEELLRHVREVNPDNKTAQGLRVMRLKVAARKQADVQRDVINSIHRIRRKAA